MKLGRKLIFILSLAVFSCLFVSVISDAQTTLAYYYGQAGNLVNTQDGNSISSYLTRQIRYDGSETTFLVSNSKDVTALVNSNGDVQKKYNYSPYGTELSYGSSSGDQFTGETLSLTQNPFTYSRYYFDSESGFYYLKARYYDPQIGEFLSMDTYNLPNRYIYVNGNPVMGIDPNGHIDENTFFLGRFVKFGQAVKNWYNGLGFNSNVEVDRRRAEIQKVQKTIKRDEDNQVNVHAKMPNSIEEITILNERKATQRLEQYAGKYLVKDLWDDDAIKAHSQYFYNIEADHNPWMGGYYEIPANANLYSRNAEENINWTNKILSKRDLETKFIKNFGDFKTLLDLHNQFLYQTENQIKGNKKIMQFALGKKLKEYKYIRPYEIAKDTVQSYTQEENLMEDGLC